MEKTAVLEKGSLFGGILLICGSSIGVGILPLPVLTAFAGTLPTFVIALLSCLFMSLTALLILEVSLHSPGNKNFISLSKNTLNKPGQIAVFLSFIFLFYSLTTAYLCKGGELTHHFLHAILPQVPFPTFSGAVLLATISGLIIFFGPRLVDYINRFFMLGFFFTYLFLAFVGHRYFHVENIAHTDWSFSFFIIPFVIISFGYHNMVPSIHEYLGNNPLKLIKAVLFSGLILLLVYGFWIFILHGIIPFKGPISLSSSFAKGEIVTEPLSLLIRSPLIQISSLYMAFFAIITSLLAQGLSIIDFLADTFKMEKGPRSRLLLSASLFLPTLFFSQTIPNVFFKALEFAGGVAAMALFGIIPALMSWKVRYHHPNKTIRPLVPGGKPLLLTVIALSSSIILYELFS